MPSSLWVRRLADGRAVIFGFFPKCPLTEGVNDAIITADIMPFAAVNATKSGAGQSNMAILARGWNQTGLHSENPRPREG